METLLSPNVSLEKLFTMSPVRFVHHVPGQHRAVSQGGLPGEEKNNNSPGFRALGGVAARD